MKPQAPYCSGGGRWFDQGRSGVCLLNSHPRCRIPRLLSGLPAVPTAKGWLRPERALVYDNPLLLLHHAAATHPGAVITEAQLAGFSKTAQRLLALLQPHGWATLQPLEFPQPEQFVFSLGTSQRDAILYDLITLRGQLQQVESLSLHTLTSASYLVFSRC